MYSRTHFLAAWAQTLHDLLRDFGVLLLLAGAPLLYAFFYPWFYAPQVVTRVPVAVIDQDHSALSRQIVRFAQASPRLDLRWTGGSEQEAQEALQRGEIEGYLVLPADLKRNVLMRQPAVATVEGNGAYTLINKTVQLGFAEVLGTVSAGVELRQLQARGQSAPQARASFNPVQLQGVALFNPTEGYGSFVVPAVALLILQQTLVMGVAMLTGTWAENGQHRATASAWLGRLLALCIPGWIAGLFYFGWFFVLHDYPRGGNPWGAVALLACYVPANAALGALLGLWVRNRERALQVMLFTTLPMAFMAGFSWPSEGLPAPLQVLRWLVPSTSGIQASLRLNQMGAPLHDALPFLGTLAAIAVVATTLVLWFGRSGRSDTVLPVQPSHGQA